MKQNERGERLDPLERAEQSAGIGIWDWDLVAGTMRWSENQWRLHGLAPDQASFDAWRASLHADDRERAAIALLGAIQDGKGYEVDYRIELPGGETRWLAARGGVFSDETGKPVRLVAVTADITERRAQAEARLLRAQKMEAVGQLTGGIAHDFNNLLQVIMGNLEFLKHRREPYLQTIEAALQATRAAAQLSRSLLAFTRLQPPEPTALDANELILGLSDTMARALGETIRVETELASGLWPTLANRNQLETALLNLVKNARDAMPRGGRLSLRSTNVTLSTPVDELPPGDYVLIEVADTGGGIPEAQLARVVEPFFTTKEAGQGAGLGLSIVSGFVKQSGGQMRIHSRVGKGTSVRVYLPRCKQAANAARARNGETLLLAEPNPDARRHGAHT